MSIQIKNGNGWLISIYSEDALTEKGLDRLFKQSEELIFYRGTNMR